jgi:hypothetical protein
MRFFSIIVLYGVITVTSLAADTVFESREAQVTLVELYTSEGCSSCPPADAWMSEMKNNPDLWTQVVPVVFHVDYWNKLGWPDSFASPIFTQRQKDYSTLWGKPSVYTPGFVINGKEWRGWFRGEGIPVTAAGSPGPLHATLRNSVELLVRFDPLGKTDLEVEVALLAMDLNVDVKHGENGGRHLKHDFVVLHLQQKAWNNGINRISLPPDILTKATALALWVRRTNTGEVVQATGGWLKPAPH